MRTKNASDFIGVKFNRWLVTGLIGVDSSHRSIVAVTCECGIQRTVRLSELRYGRSSSCGCYNKKVVSDMATVHGLSKTKLYRTWTAIKQRCYNIKCETYVHYGGRGIKMCNDWLDDFSVFYRWCVNNKWEEGLQIDRINNNGDYEPSNCRLVGYKENSRNKRSNINITINGVTKVLTDWCIEYNIKYAMVNKRLKRGWIIERALSEKSERDSTFNKRKAKNFDL